MNADERTEPMLATAQEAVAPPSPPAAPLPPANADVVGARVARRWGRAVLIALTVLVLLALAGAGGAAYLIDDHTDRYAGKMLPGTWVSGVDLSGLTEGEALARVRAYVRPDLDREIAVTWRGKRWRVTPRELGARSNAKRAVAMAFDASTSVSAFDRLRMRLFDHDLGYVGDVRTTKPRRGARAFIEDLTAKVERDPVDSTIDYSSGWVDVTPAKPGFEMNVAKSHDALVEALESGSSRAELSVKNVAPAVTPAAFDQVLLVRIGENKLYLYEDGQIAREWTVATGQPEYMTPTGLYEVTELRYLPTWVNPAPDTWGANMPASIPPGPGNPLGLRAINWSAPAIRFHGTSATYSLGYNASHGCVRMSNEDVIELYDLVEVGTPIVSVVAGELKPMYSGSSGPQAEQSTN